MATPQTKSKSFRIAVEGATTDGRVIERAWIDQMAKNYSATKYGARVNLEHIRGALPDSPFKAYGDVLALEARDGEGEFAGKRCLYATISPTADLVAMTSAKQKIYTSCEINPSFADTKEAYLVGLAVTDSPASLGTEILAFAAKNPTASPFAHKKQSPDNLFTAAVDAVVIEMEAEAPAVESIFKRVGELLGLVKTKDAKDETRFADLGQAVEVLATHGREQAEKFDSAQKTNAQLIKQVGEIAAAAEKDRAEFAALKVELSKAPNGQPARPAATGGTGMVATDC